MTPPLDRSTLESYATCPAQARYRESGQFSSVGEIAESGEQAHQAISRMIAEYVRPDGTSRDNGLVSYLSREAEESRPDVQPDVLRALKRSKWSIAEIVKSTHVNDIICFDGGDGDRSGQLACKVQVNPDDQNSTVYTVTSEVDFLRATQAPAVLEEWDWKTGHKHWTESEVYSSFQFQLHWYLIYNNFRQLDKDEPLEALDVRIMNTRHGNSTCSARFTPDSLPAIKARILQAIMSWAVWSKADPDVAQTRPTREKCSICSAATVCRIADRDLASLATDPGRFLEDTLAFQEQVDARKKLMSSWVDDTGQDIVTPHGNAYGFGKPSSSRKPAKAVYVNPEVNT